MNRVLDQYYSEEYQANGYFPDFSENKLMTMDLMDMYQTNDKMPMPAVDQGPKKRKEPMEDRELPEDVKQMRLMGTDDQRKYVRQNHSEIEKRRRDKMNNYITELSNMIPTCAAMSRKMDKLTVLRLAVQHLKSIRGSLDSYTEGNYKPPLLTDKELKQLIIPSADGFLFVVDSGRGRILYVSKSVCDVLNFNQSDLIGQSLFDILHPKDISKVKEHLSNSDVTPRERLIDSKTLLPVKGGDVPQSISRLHPGARRVFFCRMKCKPDINSVSIKEENEAAPSPMLTSFGTGSSSPKKKPQSQDKKYLSIHCTGYLKSWPLTKVGLDQDMIDSDQTDSDTAMSCLVAIGRLQPSFTTTVEDCVEKGRETAPGVNFFSRHGTDGKFCYVDQRVTLLLGYLPQELLGTSLYEHVQYEDIPLIADCHRHALKSPEEVVTPFFRFRSKEGKFVKLKSKWKQFKNPWNKEIEYIICKNYMLITKEDKIPPVYGGTFVDSGDMDFFSSSLPEAAGKDIQRVISSHAEAAKIGRQIAEEVKDKWRGPSAASSPLHSLSVPSPGSSHASQPPSRPNSQQDSPSYRDYKNTYYPKVQTIHVPGGPSSAPTESRSSPKGERESDCKISVESAVRPMNGMMREAIAEVEDDRSKLSGVIVSRSASSRCGATTSSRAAQQIRNPRQGTLSLNDQIMRGAITARQNSPPPSSTSSDGNDEAAMAVIMSLLEADAGLGGPVDFSGLPWPLP